MHRARTLDGVSASPKERGRSSLDEFEALIDWTPIAQALCGVYTAAKGELAWPPPAITGRCLGLAPTSPPQEPEGR